MDTAEFNYTRIAKAIEYITENAKAQPTLEQVAEKVHLSPFHFQRLFTDWAGVSPKKFLQFLTTQYLKETIGTTANLIEAADMAGLSAQSRVYDLFTSIEAVTPNEYKSGGIGLTISYGYHITLFGECFIAITARGICGMAFVDNGSKQNLFNDFVKKWHFARIEKEEVVTEKYIQKIFNSNEKGEYKILVQGTQFQLKVWEALLNIPSGRLTTYQGIANKINNPKAVRAVGTAIGENPIAYLIPCHRVIRKEGKLGEYRWGSIRKKLLVGWEASQSNNFNKHS